jgi:ParB family chromosome partitioning protein
MSDNPLDSTIGNAVSWVDINLVLPNPYQPRREFVDESLQELSESIAQYGILQPLTVSEVITTDASGKESMHYELVAGERRLRASKLAGLAKVPVIIRIGDSNKTKLELAIIENLQREDLNPVDRAKAFLQLATEFNLSHTEIGKRMGKSREYVSNSLRLLALPEVILNALGNKKISEGHTRPLLMLADKPDEQMVLFQDIMNYKLSVRAAEARARKGAQEKVRKEHLKTDRKILDIEETLSKRLRARVAIESAREGEGGRIVINYMNPDELGELIRIVGDTDGTGVAGILKEKQLLASEQKTKKSSASEDEKPFVFKTGFIDIDESSENEGDMLSSELVVNDLPEKKSFALESPLEKYTADTDRDTAPAQQALDTTDSLETTERIGDITFHGSDDDEWMPLSELGKQFSQTLSSNTEDTGEPDIVEDSEINDKQIDKAYTIPVRPVDSDTQSGNNLYNALFNI